MSYVEKGIYIKLILYKYRNNITQLTFSLTGTKRHKGQFLNWKKYIFYNISFLIKEQFTAIGGYSHLASLCREIGNWKEIKMKQTNRFDKNCKVVDESSKNHNTNHLNGQSLEKNKETIPSHIIIKLLKISNF